MSTFFIHIQFYEVIVKVIFHHFFETNNFENIHKYIHLFEDMKVTICIS